MKKQPRTTTKKRKTTTNAVEILTRDFVRDDPGRATMLEAERVHAEVAQMVYELRTRAKLSQADLAKQVGTTQSVISRLEDAEYRGHSLSLVIRIAAAVGRRVRVSTVRVPREARSALTASAIAI